jgi:hypothetical protein
MSIIAKRSNANFVPCPSGLHQACCVDIIDMGVIESSAYLDTKGKPKRQHKIRLAWQVAELMEDGKPFLVQKRYTLSLDEKANLRKDLESWRGLAFTEAQLGGFDLEVLIGVNCQVNVTQVQKDGQTYANVTAIVPCAKGTPKLKPVAYVRVKDRTEDTYAGEHAGDDVTEESGVPF